MNESNIFRHPEWKRLYDAVVPLLEIDRLFTYPEIASLMGLDARTNRGRQQFHRCAKEIAKDHQFQFEVVIGKGYRVVRHSENLGRMHNRTNRARRRLRDAVFIGINTKLEELTEQQRAANADILARLGTLQKMLSGERKAIRQSIVQSEPLRLPHPCLETKN